MKKTTKNKKVALIPKLIIYEGVELSDKIMITDDGKCRDCGKEVLPNFNLNNSAPSIPKDANLHEGLARVTDEALKEHGFTPKEAELRIETFPAGHTGRMGFKVVPKEESLENRFLDECCEKLNTNGIAGLGIKVHYLRALKFIRKEITAVEKKGYWEGIRVMEEEYKRTEAEAIKTAKLKTIDDILKLVPEEGNGFNYVRKEYSDFAKQLRDYITNYRESI